MVWLVWPNASGSCAGGSVAIGGAFNARQVKDDDPEEKQIQDLHFGVGRGAKHKAVNIFSFDIFLRRG